MKLVSLAFILGVGLLSAAGQYLLKLGLAAATADGAQTGALAMVGRIATNLNFIGAGIIYVIAFALYLFVLAKSDVSQIFPAAIGINIICVTTMAAVFLGETIALPRLAGVAMIVLGVYVVSRT